MLVFSHLNFFQTLLHHDPAVGLCVFAAVSFMAVIVAIVLPHETTNVEMKVTYLYTRFSCSSQSAGTFLFVFGDNGVFSKRTEMDLYLIFYLKIYVVL